MNMRVFITGATGFVGRAVVLRLLRDDHQPVAWVRSPDRARSQLGGDVELVDSAGGDGALGRALAGCDAVINLAGEPVAGGRWTARRKRALIQSRVELTERLVRAIAAASRRPGVLISASAVGYYGDRCDELLDESSSPGTGFLADLCQRWEEAARPAEASGLRVALLRIGVVLGREGGALAKMLPAFRAGLGGPVGSGRQYLPWIHLHDLVAVIVAALRDERIRGAVNATAPQPVTSRDFARALGGALGRPAVLPVPATALRLALGEAASMLLGGQRAVPARLQEAGFRHAFPTIQEALSDVLGGPPVDIDPVHRAEDDQDVRDSAYLSSRRPRFVLRSSTVLDAPVDRVFPFFSRPENLGLMTPSTMDFRIQEKPETVDRGAQIAYRIRVGPVPFRWRTRIEEWEPLERFVDSQESGPYSSWWHEHRFVPDGDRTVMEDRVYYAPPLGWLGVLANRFLLAPTLRGIFGYRADAIRLRFGTPEEKASESHSS